MFQLPLFRANTHKNRRAEELFLQLELKRFYSEQKLEIGVAAEGKVGMSAFLYLFLFR
jgi:hypothetical protein